MSKGLQKSMTVANYNLNQLWLQLGKYQNQLRHIVVALLALYLIAFLADLTWRLIPAPEQANSGNYVENTSRGGVNNGKSNQLVNISKVKNLNLFGNIAEKPKDVPVNVDNAPKTTLNLTLSGVVASSNADVAAAIIESRGKQNTYGINDKIDGTNAFLTAVYEDRVIIRNGSRNETLMMEGVDGKTPTMVSNNRSTPTRSNTPSRPRQVSSQAQSARQALQKRPMSFTDYIAISPHRVDNVLRGYRVRPGRKPELFQAAGFVAGDVVTEINGLNLADPQQSIEAMKQLRSAETLQMTVDRGGETLSLNIDFSATEEEN
ncbi:type II secretion system protein GspC [Aestuariibacter sp. AA17]|uniref:Type II secretion system protein GspC n=1 Tax=Fluctibacter corallii TaxID=2984329 RepID=A0ABT3AAU5_9ALTE|nr:type II secretion system protein GspC [Aestuariibacter sp. AA17]MCV2885799.1 type II secretion system protein GspC [Aestuariibacter sp. AA17]